MEYRSNLQFWEDESKTDQTNTDQSIPDKEIAIIVTLPQDDPPIPPPLPKTKEKCCAEITKTSAIIIALGVLSLISVAAALIIYFVCQSEQAHASSYNSPSPSSPSQPLTTPNSERERPQFGYNPYAPPQRHLGNLYQPSAFHPPHPRVRITPAESHQDNSLKLFRRFEFHSNGMNDKIVFHLPGLMLGDVQEGDAECHVSLNDDEQNEFNRGWNSLRQNYEQSFGLRGEDLSFGLQNFISEVYVRWLGEQPEIRNLVFPPDTSQHEQDSESAHDDDSESVDHDDPNITRKRLIDFWGKGDIEEATDPISLDKVSKFNKGERFVSVCGDKRHLFSKRDYDPWYWRRKGCPICRAHTGLKEFVLVD